MSVPLLSVCLITYNHSKYIHQAIEGVLMQKVDFDFELIIADDLSTDGTRKIILDYKSKYPEFIRLILQEKNVGPGKNWFDLITKPKSKYIAYLEGDDYWTDRDKLQKQVDYFERNPTCSLHFHNVRKLLEATNESPPFNKIDIGDFNPSIDDILNLRVGVPSCSWLLRREKMIIPTWIFDCAMGDWPIILFLGSTGTLHYSSEIMGVYRKHEKGASNRIVNGKLSLIKILKLFKMDVPSSTEVVDENLGRLYLEASVMEKRKQGHYIKYFEYLCKALFYQPPIIVRHWRSILFLVMPLTISKRFGR